MKERLWELPTIHVGVTILQHVYLLLQVRRRLEPQDAAGRYACGLPGLWVGALALLFFCNTNETKKLSFTALPLSNLAAISPNTSLTTVFDSFFDNPTTLFTSARIVL